MVIKAFKHKDKSVGCHGGVKISSINIWTCDAFIKKGLLWQS